LQRFDLRLAVLFIVVAATAMPIELRSPDAIRLGFAFNWIDILENVAGFVPVGVALAGLGKARAIAVAFLLSAFAESCQFFMQHRDPSVIDVVTNSTGAAIGVYLFHRWNISLGAVPATRWLGAVAGACALVILLGISIWGDGPLPSNPRGWMEEGILEAQWKPGASAGRVLPDASGQGHDGRLFHDAQLAAGPQGAALRIEGATSRVVFGTSSAFRMVGSMTISAWINSSEFPPDDAAILSTFNRGEIGYQLDTTIDRGPRTIGFKLGNACGHLMARYGATPLVAGRWYHIAGVYDARARTLDVYLNGKLDNGFLKGEVTSSQRAARSPLYLGRRGLMGKFNFSGLIGDIRLYSFALTGAEILEDMRGGTIRREAVAGGFKPIPETPCRIMSDPEDARLPGAVAAFGVLVAIAVAGLAPGIGVLSLAGACFLAALSVFPAIGSSLPMGARCLMPVISLAGSLAVVVPSRRTAGNARRRVP
jgi:Concanavalin A-like lectin/glucanases superfamily/VanZ like family